MKNLTRYMDLLPTLGPNLHLVTYVSLGGNPWQTYLGEEVYNLKEEILDRLYVQQITAQLTFEKEGMYPVLVIYTSDDVRMIEFKLPTEFKGKPNDTEEEDNNGD